MTRREAVEAFVRHVHRVKPPTKRELYGRAPEEDILQSIDELIHSKDDALAILTIMQAVTENPQINLEDLPDIGMPGKVSCWWKVYNGWD